MIFERGHIDKNTTLARLYADFKGITQWYTYPKHYKIHCKHTVCNDLFMIQTGLARAFYHKGKPSIVKKSASP
jgi:hypothetical protein